jgi:hypothetical protein
VPSHKHSCLWHTPYADQQQQQQQQRQHYMALSSALCYPPMLSMCR